MEIVFDVEANGLEPDKLYCLCYADSQGDIHSVTDYEEMRKVLLSATTLVGHNVCRWDIPVLERLLGIKITARIVDTMALSWTLFPNRDSHNLDDYGNEFGIPKPKITDWSEQPIETYLHRCVEDVKITVRLYNRIHWYLKKLYEDEAKLWEYVEYISFKMYCAHLQEKSRWKIDLQNIGDALAKLEQEKLRRTEQLRAVMPQVEKFKVKTPPVRSIKKDGTYTKLGREWFDTLELLGLPAETEEITVHDYFEEPNPSSPVQIKDYLFSLGWIPQTIEYKKDKETGEEREVPQINQKHGKGLDPGAVALIDDYPELEALNGLSVLGHRISILKSLLASHKNGYVQATVQGLTNTLRFQHAKPCVNLPKPDRLYASDIRASFIAEDGSELCGADMSSLEDRLKQHYIYPYDPEYVREMQEDGYDPHLKVCLTADMLTQEEVDEYKTYVRTEGKDGSKRNSRVRDMGKNGGYAMQYGARPNRLVKTLGIPLKKAKQLFKGYWELNWAIEKVADEQVVKTIRTPDGEQMWLLNPVSGFWYSLRFEKDKFSTLIQGTASYVFDLWVQFVLIKRPQLTATFHDEAVWQVKQGHRDDMSKLIRWAMNQLNERLKLNRELDCGIQYGSRYSEIH